MLSRSTVLYQNGSQLESQERTSSTAYLPLDDHVVERITRRAEQFQGYLPIKDVQVTSYQEGQQYVPHYDWFTEPDRRTNRLSTFFAILEADCEKCGTQFPRLSFNWAERHPSLCELVDCSQEILTTRNIEGSAIYWRNLDAAGRGRWDTLHAGLPALNGTKIGLNIWTEVDVSNSDQAGH
jgi:prolyl 4-hydroxylase